MHLSVTTVDTQPTLHWSPVPDTHLLSQGWRDSAFPSPLPRDTAALLPAATLGYTWPGPSPVGLQLALLTDTWPTGAKGCGDMSGCNHSPGARLLAQGSSTLYEAPAQGQARA